MSGGYYFHRKRIKVRKKNAWGAYVSDPIYGTIKRAIELNIENRVVYSEPLATKSWITGSFANYT